MNKKYISIMIVLVIIGTVGISLADDREDAINNIKDIVKPGSHIIIGAFEDLYRLFMKLSLPHSLDNTYKGTVPETLSSNYLFEMIKMVGMFEGIVVNMQNNDTVNAMASFDQFDEQYKNVSKMVPAWERYFDTGLVDDLGKDLKKDDTKEIFKDIDKIGKSCDRCHDNEIAQVWAKYYWRDFETVNVSTPEGNLSWPEAMPKYLAAGFDGIGVNAMLGKQKEAQESFDLFKSMYLNFKDACNNCHTTPRFYFVSDDVFVKIDEMGKDIADNKLSDAAMIQQQLGENCHRCHVIHQPPQRMKAKMEK